MISKDNKIFLAATSRLACWPSLALFSKIFKFIIENWYTIVDNIYEANYVIINTCWFDDYSEQHAINVINNLYSKYSLNDNKIIVVWCLPDIWSKKDSWKDDKILVSDRNISKLDEFFKNNVSINEIQVSDIVKPKVLKEDTTIMDFGDNKMFSTLNPVGDKNTFFVEISSWCNQHCSYCAIKKVKWNTKSKSIEFIIKEIDRWINLWFDKIYLISDDCWSYWEDIWTNISLLLNNIFQIYPKLQVSLNYFEPSNFLKYFKYFNKAFINNIKYICVPLQTTSQRILKMMNRDYDIQTVIDELITLKKINKNMYLDTQLIYWFPTETIEEFKDSLKVLNIFDCSMFFCFSPKDDTVASKYKWRLKTKDLFLRTNTLIKLSSKNNLKNHLALHYQDYEKLFDIYSKYWK